MDSKLVITCLEEILRVIIQPKAKIVRELVLDFKSHVLTISVDTIICIYRSLTPRLHEMRGIPIS